jgi:hypothetical protein
MTSLPIPKPTPVGAGNPVILCDLRIFADQPAEPVPAENPDAGVRSGRMRTPAGRTLFQRPVRPVRVSVIGIFAEDRPQVPFPGDQHPVQALAAGAGNPAFRSTSSRMAGAVRSLPGARRG